jgi:hypothetical protein
MNTEREYTEAEELAMLFSDLHKDVHGFRPRFGSDEEWASVEWLKAEIAACEAAWPAIQAREEAAEKAAVAAFEAVVAATIAAGAPDRRTALRWLVEGEGDAYALHDIGYFEHGHGLPYGYMVKHGYELPEGHYGSGIPGMTREGAAAVIAGMRGD